MIRSEDLADVFWDEIRPKAPPPAPDPVRRAPTNKGRVFLSEYEIKKMLNGEKILKVPLNAILSPLAQDWLGLKGISVVREG